MSDWPKATRIPPTGWASERDEKPVIRVMLGRLPKVGDCIPLKACAGTGKQRQRCRAVVASDRRFKVTRSGRCIVIVRVQP